jgi:xylan 1,4-beta-xylosidase
VRVREPDPRGLTKPIPVGRRVALVTVDGDVVLTVPRGLLIAQRDTASRRPVAAAPLRVVDRGLGRVALQTNAGFLSTDSTGAHVVVRRGAPGDGETFQWVETPYGFVALLSLASHRYLHLDASGSVSADRPGPTQDPADGINLRWRTVSRAAVRR